jgi:hypothetical protein
LHRKQAKTLSEVPRAISPPKEEVPAIEVPSLQSLWLSGSPSDDTM